MKERQEIHCHNCGQWVQFEIDLSMDGNHVLNCPNCDHEHCRVVKKGVITDIRWDQRNGPNIYIQQYSAITASNTMTFYMNQQYSAGNTFTADLWGSGYYSTGT